MTTPNDRRPDPDNAATDPRAAAQQDQVKRDHDALEEQARRVEASVPSNQQPATDPDAAAKQDQVRADHDRMQESARRVEASVPADVRDTPVQPANIGTQATDEARANADAARDSARRVADSVTNPVTEERDRDRR